MTQVPARLFGLATGAASPRASTPTSWCSIPRRSAPSTPTLVHDLPADSPRLTAESIGVVRVLVNGVVTVVDDQPTGDLPGTVLRSGRDTDTVVTA